MQAEGEVYYGICLLSSSDFVSSVLEYRSNPVGNDRSGLL